MATMSGATRSYLKEFGAAMAAYVVVLPISIFIITAHPHAGWRFALALAPVVPAAFALWAFIRQLGRMDELQRRIQFEALAMAFGAAGLLTFSYGFLEGAGFPHLSWIFIFPLMIALWGISSAIASYRYR